MKNSLSQFICVVVFIFLSVSPLRAEKPADIKKSEDEIRKQMLSWSLELGVTCTECHNPKNFKEPHGKSFDVALIHSRIVTAIRDQGMDGTKGPQANCFMCHRGELHPPFRSESEKK